MIQSVYTTAHELLFVKGLGVKTGVNNMRFSAVTTARRILLQRYLKANKNRRVDTNSEGYPSINFDIVFNAIYNEVAE